MPTPDLLAQPALPLALILTPLAASLLIGVFLRGHGKLAAAVSVAAAAVIAGLATVLAFGGDRGVVAMDWLELGDLRVRLGFLVDDLTALLMLVVGWVGLLIHIFSLGYMKDDPRQGAFFGGLSLFMFAMTGLTVADDLIMLFIFWELVGLASFLLINFYFTKPEAVKASRKAFITNRVGDFGFLLGIILAYWGFGTITLPELAGHVNDPGVQATLTAIGLLLFCGCVGKSGQVPLHVWLPDAMAGPTPVSALIHAATMVAAGIFLLCRVGVVMTADALNVILAVGTATAVLAGLWAVAQRDIKKILAYSTVSQLGYMVAAFALGSLLELGTAEKVGLGVAAAMFHLMTHAFFKALLFLGSGSIIHACHHEQDIFRMGGLRKRMPVTFLAFTAGLLALIGAPYTAGFFSKDAILSLALEQNRVVFYLLAGSALVTAFYMARLWAVVFLGEPRSEGAQHAHENGVVMTGPLVVLAVLSLVGGFGFFYSGVLGGAVHDVLNHESLPHPEGATGLILLAVSLAGLAAAALAVLFYGASPSEDRLERTRPSVFGFLKGRLWFDEAYRFWIDVVQQPAAEVLSWLEAIFISGLMVRGSAAIAQATGFLLRSSHLGLVRAYAFWFVAGIVLLWAAAAGLT